MDDFNNKQSGELNGFDSVNGNDTPNENNGYTVTPDGGFYTKSREDIIQDEAVSGNDTAYTAEPVGNSNKAESTEQTPPPRRDFFPNGEYGAYNGGANYDPQTGRPLYNYKPPKPKKPKTGKKYGAGVVVLAALLAAVIGAVSGIAAVNISKTDGNTSPAPSNVSGQNVNINIDETAESVVEAVAKKVTPSVVGIRTTTAVMSFFGGTSESTGEGSGVVYSADGYIITNYHVISGAVTNKSGSKIEVFVGSLDSDSYEASVVGYNINSDLAVLKINASGLTAVEFADSSDLKVGQYVITVGNPGGLEFMDSVTYGVISGLNRVVSSDSDVKLIQTDAAINPGNSGGALVNVKGQLVGVNSSKIVSEEFEGMGFAIPSNTVDEICKKIIEKQNDPEPYIGVTISEKYTASVLKYYGYPAGAVISSVAEGSPAENAGLAKGDIITEFTGKTIGDYTVLSEVLEDCKPNDKVSVKIYRSGRYYTTTITVGSNNAVS